MTKFLNVVVAILSVGLIIQYLFGFTACIVYCACLVSCYLFLKKTGPSQQESLWLSSVVNFSQNFGRNLPYEYGKVIQADGSKENLYLNLNRNSPNTVSSFLAAMFGEGKTSFSLFSLFSRNNKDGGVSKTLSSSDGIRNMTHKRNLNIRRIGAVDGDLSGSSPMARCTSYTPMSTRHHPRHRNRITNVNTSSEQIRTISGRKFGSPLANSSNRTFLSSPLPRFHRTASETQERPVISPVGFTPHALQRPEVCYPYRNVPGILPHVHLDKKIKIPLLETNINKLRSPVTVRIAPPETGAIHSPKFTSLKHDVPTAASPGDVLTALREGSRKRANNEEDSVIMINNMNAKRRRQDSNHSTVSSSSTIPSLSDFLPDLALCNFSPTYMSPDTSRYMSSPAVSAAMSDDEGGGGGGSKRPVAHCVHSPHSEGSPNLKRSRYRCKNNPILSSLSSSHRYMKRQTEIRKRKISDSAEDGSFQHLRQSKENYENISSELETEKPLGKVMKPSLDASVNEDSLVETSSEKLPEQTTQVISNLNSVENKKSAADLPRRKLLSFTTPSVNMEKLSYANVYATKQDYENDRKAEQERIEKMLDSIANDKASSVDKDLMTAKTGIEISKNLISTTKSLETATSKSSTDVSQTIVTTSGSLSLSSTSSLLSSAAATITAAAAATTSTTTTTWPLTASLSPKSIATTTTPISSKSSSEQPARLTSNTTSVNSMITPLPSLSTSAYAKASDAEVTAPSSSLSSSSPTSQIQMKSGFQFDLKGTSPLTPTATVTAAQTLVPPSLSVTTPQLSTTCTTISSSGLVGTMSNSGFQFAATASSPSVTTASTGPFLANISSPFSAPSTSPAQKMVAAPLSTTPTTATDAIKPPSSSSSAPSSAGFVFSSKAGYVFPTAVGNPFGAGASVMSSAVASPASAQTQGAAANTPPASFPSFKANTSTGTNSNLTSTSATSTSGHFLFGNTSASLNQPASNTAAASTVTFGAPNATPTKFAFNAICNTTTTTVTTNTPTTTNTTAAFGVPSFVFGASTSTAAPVFGESTSTTAPVFGISTTKSSLVFGASSSAAAPIFGSPSSATSSSFGTSTSPIFGAPTSTAAFGASTSLPAPGFGVPASTVSSIFGSSSTTTAAPAAITTTTTAVASPSNSIFNVPQVAATSPIFGSSNIISTAAAFAAPATALNIFSTPTATASSAFGAPSMVTSSKVLTSTTTPVTASIFSNPSSTFGGFKDVSQTGQSSAAAPSGATTVFGSSSASCPSSGFNFTLNDSTSKPTSSIFDPTNAQSPTVIFGNGGQQQQQNQQQQKTDQKFNFTLNSNSGNPAPFGKMPNPFTSFESKPSIFSGQSSAAESTAIKTPTIFGQVPATTVTGSATSVAKPLFGQLSTSGFAAPSAQSGGNPTMFDIMPAATATSTTKPADSANTQNTNIFTFGKTPSTQSGTSQGFDFSSSMAGTSQFNFGQGVAMFNVGSGSTAPKMRSNNKARRRGGKK